MQNLSSQSFGRFRRHFVEIPAGQSRRVDTIGTGIRFLGCRTVDIVAAAPKYAGLSQPDKLRAIIEVAGGGRTENFTPVLGNCYEFFPLGERVYFDGIEIQNLHDVKVYVLFETYDASAIISDTLSCLGAVRLTGSLSTFGDNLFTFPAKRMQIKKLQIGVIVDLAAQPYELSLTQGSYSAGSIYERIWSYTVTSTSRIMSPVIEVSADMLSDMPLQFNLTTPRLLTGAEYVYIDITAYGV